MLKYLACGSKNFITEPVGVTTRVNWEFMAALDDPFGPLLADRTPPPVRTRHLWVFPPGTPHGWRSGGAVRRAVFQFGLIPPPLDTRARAASWHECPLTRGEALRVFTLAESLRPHFERPTEVSMLRFQHALYELSLLALGNIPARQFSRPEDLAEQKVEAAGAWFSEHMAQDPTLADMARAVRLSPAHLRRIFWKSRGKNPLAVISEARVRRAMEMMANSEMKLEAIAEACGYGSAANFSRAFRRHQGVSPGEWRKGRLN